MYLPIMYQNFIAFCTDCYINLKKYTSKYWIQSHKECRVQSRDLFTTCVSIMFIVFIVKECTIYLVIWCVSLYECIYTIVISHLQWRRTVHFLIWAVLGGEVWPVQAVVSSCKTVLTGGTSYCSMYSIGCVLLKLTAK